MRRNYGKMDREGYARRKRDIVGFEWKGGRDFKRERLGHGGGTKYSWDGIDGNVLEVHDHLFFCPSPLSIFFS